MEDFELQNIEYKVIWKKEFLDEICGMANASGGKVYIGKDDDGNTIDLGVQETKRLLEAIPNSIVRALNYSNVSVDAKKDSNGFYIEIIVHKSDTPVFYQGSMYKRIGTANFKVEGNQQQKALIEVRNRTWDSSVVDNVSIDDLDEESFQIFRQEAIASGRISGKALENREKILEELDLIRDGKLTIAAILLFHRNPFKVIPGASILIGKMRNDADVVSSDEIKGSLMILSRSILDIIKVKYLYALISYDMPTRIETYPYPFDALREAVFNSLMHNDWSSGQSILIKVYDHSLSILNRAIVDDDWTVEHHKSRHINPLISNAFNKAGLVEKFGTGITKMIDLCKDAGNPVPIFETASSGLDFCVTFHASRLYRAIEKYRAMNNDSVVDYRKVLTQIDKLTENDEPSESLNYSLSGDYVRINGDNGSLNGRINKGNGSLNGRINDESGSLTSVLSNNESANNSETDDFVYLRKKQILMELKEAPQSTIGHLVLVLGTPERTIYRDIEWLKENGYLERLGSKKAGFWHVIKELE